MNEPIFVKIDLRLLPRAGEHARTNEI